jgi:hypothetical protein
MQAEFDAKMLALNAEINNKANDEKTKQDAIEREAKMRLEMEFKLE